MSRAITIKFHAPGVTTPARYRVTSGNFKLWVDANVLCQDNIEQKMAECAKRLCEHCGWNPDFLTSPACVKEGLWTVIFDTDKLPFQVGRDSATDRQDEIYVSRPFGRFAGLDEVCDIQLRRIERGEWVNLMSIRLGSAWQMTIACAEALLEARDVPISSPKASEFIEKLRALMMKAPR